MKRGWLFAALFISSLLVSIIIIQLLFISPLILGNSIYTYLTIVIGILAISLLTYYSFSTTLSNKANLLVMLIISMISLIPTFFINSGLKKFFSLISTAAEVEGLAGQIPSLFSINELINIWMFSILVIVLYNITPSIAMFRTKSSVQSQP